jgi:hypothetical protein
MSERTWGQKFGQWLNNWVVLASIFSSLGGAALYGNSDTVKEFVHGKSSPLTVEDITPVAPENYDRVIKEIIDKLKTQGEDIKTLKEWHE